MKKKRLVPELVKALETVVTRCPKKGIRCDTCEPIVKLLAWVEKRQVEIAGKSKK